MRARVYGLIVLILVGIAPLTTFGYVALRRSQATTIKELRSGNARLARLIAERIAGYTQSERRLLAAIGASARLAPNDEQALALLEAYALHHSHFHAIVVFDEFGHKRIRTEDAVDAEYSPFVAKGLRQVASHSDVKPADVASGGFAHTMIFAEPIIIAGKPAGVIIAQVDLIGVWEPVNSIRIGKTGFARLLSVDGQLLAHGDPEERRFVFAADKVKDAALIAGALLGGIAKNNQGIDVVASVAIVPGFNWLVTVEQTVEEAFAATSAMQRDLLVFAMVALLVAVCLGVLSGRELVRGLERLRAHTRVLAQGALGTVFQPNTKLEEISALADSLNDMAASLKRLQDEAASRERLTTFSRVAAGLAHDLRQPIESLRGACDQFFADPKDENAKTLLDTVAKRDLLRLKHYVDDLHRLAKQGGVEYTRQNTCLNTLAKTVAEELGQTPKWRGIQFIAEGNATRDSLVDASLIRRAVINLAGNGADACLEHQPRGIVKIQVVDEANDSVAIRITDTGKGIAKGQIQQLFRSDFKSTKHSSGVGLGLGVVLHVAEVHGAQLDVSSVVGVGSTFTLTIPYEPNFTNRDCEAEVGGGEKGIPLHG